MARPGWGYCPNCLKLFGPEDRPCDHRAEGACETVAVGSAVGLVGFRNTGKSVYLATLFDQLSHSAPEWGVDIGERAFDKLSFDYGSLRRGIPLPASRMGGGDYFLMKVCWRRRSRLDLLLWDASGEEYGAFATGYGDHRQLEKLLPQCPSILVTLLAANFRLGGQPQGLDVGDEDRLLGQLFRRVLRKEHRVRRVIALLVGVDVYGDSPAEAEAQALRDFGGKYRVFPGVVKNAGLALDAVPVSNIGFGNTWEKLGEGAPLVPYNVLEPLRRALRHYLPWWRRLFLPGGKGWAPAPAAPASVAPETEPRGEGASPPAPAKPATTSRPPDGGVFISYRREGGAETARLVRKELEARGWRVFLDVDDLKSSYFDDRLLREIENADGFVLILSPGSLDRCAEPDDWLRREIAHALVRGKRIVPVLKEGFRFPPKESLPADVRELLRHNAVLYSHNFFEAAMSKVATFLSEEGGATGRPPGPSEAIRWKCPSCGAPIRAPREHAGRRAKCPRCDEPQTVPGTG